MIGPPLPSQEEEAPFPIGWSFDEVMQTWTKDVVAFPSSRALGSEASQFPSDFEMPSYDGTLSLTCSASEDSSSGFEVGSVDMDELIPSQRWVLPVTSALCGLVETHVLAGFPGFPLYQAMEYEANLLFNRVYNPRPVPADPALVDVGFLSLLKENSGGQLLSVVRLEILPIGIFLYSDIA